MFYVRMIDKFMSGWGKARGMRSVYVVVCDTYEQAEQIERAAQRRPEMTRITISETRPRTRKNQRLDFTKYADMGGPWLAP